MITHGLGEDMCTRVPINARDAGITHSAVIPYVGFLGCLGEAAVYHLPKIPKLHRLILAI